jgi:hypothetical protein
MLEALDITEEDAAGLADLAAVHLKMAKEFAARAQVVDDPELACKLAAVSQRHSRAFRQNLAIKLRLKREMMRVAAETPPAPEPEKPHVPRDAQRIKARLAEVRAPLHRIIWSEHDWTERPEDLGDRAATAHYFRDFDDWLEREADDNAFGLQPLDEHVVELARAAGLCEAAATRWRDLPDPPPAAYADPRPGYAVDTS